MKRQTRRRYKNTDYYSWHLPTHINNLGLIGWEGISQVCATLLGARHVPERLCGDGPCLQRGAITSVRPLPLPFYRPTGGVPSFPSGDQNYTTDSIPSFVDFPSVLNNWSAIKTHQLPFMRHRLSSGQRIGPLL